MSTAPSIIAIASAMIVQFNLFCIFIIPFSGRYWFAEMSMDQVSKSYMEHTVESRVF
jgi:hypothetical protein